MSLTAGVRAGLYRVWAFKTTSIYIRAIAISEHARSDNCYFGKSSFARLIADRANSEGALEFSEWHVSCYPAAQSFITHKKDKASRGTVRGRDQLRRFPDGAGVP